MLATMVVPPSLSVVGSRSGDVPERGGTGAAGSPPSGETMSTTNPPDPPNPLSLIFEVTKAEVDLQFKLAERFDAKGRGFFTIAAAFFVAAQTIALRADVLDALKPDQKDTILTIACFAAAALGLGMFALWALTRPSADMEYDAERLRERLTKADEPFAVDHMLNSYISLLHVRQHANQTRRRRLSYVQVDGLIVIAICSAELVIALNLLT